MRVDYLSFLGRAKDWRCWDTLNYKRQGLKLKEHIRLRLLPRYHPTVTTILGHPVRLVDARSFLSMYNQIFKHEAYRFPSATPNPRILDCGANIGLAILYWKQLYPSCRITAFEPDPDVFAALTWNCMQWQFGSVELVNEAVWNRAGEFWFSPEGADAGHLVEQPQRGGASDIMISAVRLRDYLGDATALLKLDIEGSEADVLVDCATCLGQVQNIFVEYHSIVGQEQRLDEVLHVLRSAGFRVHLHPELVSPMPFVYRVPYQRMDHSVNIFAFRS